MGGKSDGVGVQIWRVESRDGIDQNTLTANFGSQMLQMGVEQTSSCEILSMDLEANIGSNIWWPEKQ